jgi:hypothetical protein
VKKIFRVTGVSAAAGAAVLMMGGFGARPAASSAASAGAVASRPAASRPSALRPGGLIVRSSAKPGAASGVSSAALANAIESDNWAGYVSHATGVTFRHVQATFFVPYLNCTVSPGAAGAPTASSEWVGLDGFSSGTVEQDGIEADCAGAAGATPTYQAWYEVFPAAEVPSTITVHAGDSITASVVFTASTRMYLMTVKDNTDGQHFSVSKFCKITTCLRTSAEVISEAPSEETGGTITQLPMADYGAESFTGISVTDAKGQAGGLRSAHWGGTRIIQVGPTSGAVIGQSTPLQGGIFDDYWLGED